MWQTAGTMKRTSEASGSVDTSAAAELLRAIWAKHLVPTRTALAHAVSNMYVQTIHNNIVPDSGSALSRRLALIPQHFEPLVRKVVAEFKEDAIPEPATSRFLATEAVPLLENLIAQAVRHAHVDFDRVPLTELNRDNSVSGTVVVLEQVARTEIRALKASAKFARPVTTQPELQAAGPHVIITGDGNRVIAGDGNSVGVEQVRPDAGPSSRWKRWAGIVTVGAGAIAAIVRLVEALLAG